MSTPRIVQRRTILAGLLGAAGATALAGCNRDGAGGGGVLNVWGGVPAESGPDDLIKAFEAANPDIKVTYTRYVNDEPGNLKLDTSLQGGVPIDVFFSYGLPVLSKRSPLALDLTEKIAADPDLATFSSEADPATNYTLDGKQFCVPAAHGPVNVYVNETMIADAGITLPETWTIDEFRDIAKALSKPGEVFGCFNAPSIARATLGPNHYYADGGLRSNFDAPPFRQQLEFAAAMQKEGIAMSQQQVLAEKLQTFSQTPFLTGRTAMVIGAGHLTRYISDTKEYPHDFKTIAMPTPEPVAGKEYWNEGQLSDLMSISAKSKNQDAAWTLIKFWVLNAGTYMIKGGRLPATVAEAEPAEMIEQLLGPDRDTLYDAESFERVLFHSDLQLAVDTISTASTQIDQIWMKLTDEVLLGDRTIDSWVTEATKQADAAIASAS